MTSKKVHKVISGRFKLLSGIWIDTAKSKCGAVRIIYPMLIAKRWKRVTCKNCLRSFQ